MRWSPLPTIRAARGRADRVLSYEEIRRLWRLLSVNRRPTNHRRPGASARGTADDPICPVAPAMAAAIKMRLLTAQRGEVIKMRWRVLDLKTAGGRLPR